MSVRCTGRVEIVRGSRVFVLRGQPEKGPRASCLECGWWEPLEAPESETRPAVYRSETGKPSAPPARYESLEARQARHDAAGLPTLGANGRPIADLPSHLIPDG